MGICEVSRNAPVWNWKGTSYPPGRVEVDSGFSQMTPLPEMPGRLGRLTFSSDTERLGRAANLGGLQGPGLKPSKLHQVRGMEACRKDRPVPEPG